MPKHRARYGWESDFPDFADASSIDVRKQLRHFVSDASPEQERAWSSSIPQLQDEIEEVLLRNQLARDYSAILEYELPMESRRPDGDASPLSCRQLTSCVTEFGAQGLELDGTLLAWGADLLRKRGTWSNANARGYQRQALVRDPFQLRLNAYRVLFTRARDVAVAFLPRLVELDETFHYLTSAGFKELTQRTGVNASDSEPV